MSALIWLTHPSVVPWVVAALAFGIGVGLCVWVARFVREEQKNREAFVIFMRAEFEANRAKLRQIEAAERAAERRNLEARRALTAAENYFRFPFRIRENSFQDEWPRLS